ncbi:hypothetical protein HK105_209128 [Polyrhizophydium stewartii]|uniref:Uncharacterized protein n=1 Tax=Polyrhizophydium stewartii TaxID=2732419 RepID=A0ABR4MVX1_9FUNG
MTVSLPSTQPATLGLLSSNSAARTSTGDAAVPLTLLGVSPLFTADVALASASAITSALTAAYFVRRCMARGPTPAILALICVNVFALVLQIAEALYVHIGPTFTGIQVAAVFQGSLIRLPWLDRDRLVQPRLVAVVVHLVCCWPPYLQGWAAHYRTDTFSGKWFRICFALYTLMVALFGVALNLLIFSGVRRNITHAPPATGARTTAFSGSRHARVNFLPAFIVVVMLFDIAAFGFFVLSLPLGNEAESNVRFNSLVQISLAFIGAHMSAETIMLEWVVTIFRDEVP